MSQTSVLRVLGSLHTDEPLVRAALGDSLSLCGGRHPRTISATTVLAESLIAQGRDAEAEPLLRAALATQRRELGHATAGPMVQSLAAMRLRDGAVIDAERLARQAFAIAQGTAAPEAVAVASLAPAVTLGAALAQQGQLDAAARVCDVALDSARTALGAGHPDALAAARAAAAVADAQGRAGDAEALLDEALSEARAAHGAEHPEALVVGDALADLLVRVPGRARAALHLLLDALRVRVRTLGEGHPRTLATRERIEAAEMAVRAEEAAVREEVG